MMNCCHMLNVYGQQIQTLLAVIFTMLACSKIAKKHREETAYTAVVGISLLCIVNIVLSGPVNQIIGMLNASNHIVNALWGAVVYAAIITALLMVVGKALKIKKVNPKHLAICFFVGIALANLAGMLIAQQCSAKPAKHHKQG